MTIWLIAAQLASGDWQICPGWYSTERDATHEIASRSVGRYQINYRVVPAKVEEE